MKITKRELRRIIRESRADDEGRRGWQDFFAGDAPDPAGSDWYLDGYDDAEKAHRDNPEKYPVAMRETSSWKPLSGAHAEELGEPKTSALHGSGRNNNVMNQLHTAIDALIATLGNEEARQELLGIVEEWDSETY